MNPIMVLMHPNLMIEDRITRFDSYTDTLFCFPVTEKELKRLHRRFKKLDKDGSGTLTIDEFTSIPELAGSATFLSVFLPLPGHLLIEMAPTTPFTLLTYAFRTFHTPQSILCSKESSPSSTRTRTTKSSFRSSSPL